MIDYITGRVELDALEIHQAKNIWALSQKRYKGKHKYKAKKSDMDAYGWYGFAAEIALAKYLGNIHGYNPNIKGSATPDVGDYDVRQTRWPTGKLIIHPHEADDRITVLVTGQENVYYMRGWLQNIDAKQKEYWTELNKGRPAYCVPQRFLNDMGDLPEWSTFIASLA